MMKRTGTVVVFFCMVGSVWSAQKRIAPSSGAGEKPVTAQIQKAVDDLSQSGGGTVLLEKGTYVAGSIILKSGVTLRLEKGAVILGSTNYSDYAATPSHGRSLIYAEDAENVALEGKGVIDGRGYTFTRKDGAPHRPKNALFFRCKKVRVEGVTLKNAGSWTCHFRECDGVIAKKVTISGHANFNNDGFDIDSRNVEISDCVIDSDDDAICFKSDNPAFIVENATVRNCKVSSNCNFIKFGTSCFGGFRNITVRDCDLFHCSKSILRHWENQKLPGVTDPITGLDGIALEVVDGGFMENVCVSNITMRDVQTPILIRLARRHASPGSYLKNILIQNVKGSSSSLIASSITGVPGLRVEHVVLKDIALNLKAGGKAADTLVEIPEKEQSYPENRMFDKLMLPAYGFYIRHADNIRMENVKLTFSGGREERHAIVADDVNNVQFVNCAFQKPDGTLGTFSGVSGK